MSVSDLIEVEIRDPVGQSWTEWWPKEKVVYLVLASDLEPPKHENSRRKEWISLDTHLYRWKKSEISDDEFSDIATRWPGRGAPTFRPSACDRVQLSYDVDTSSVGIGYNPSQEPALFARMLLVAEAHLTYIGFDYLIGRHVFGAPLERHVREMLFKDGAEIRRALDRVKPGLARSIESGHAQNVIVRLLMREDEFEPPFHFWSEA